MLLGTPTKSGTGIKLIGDYYDLDQLYRTIHRLADNLDLRNAHIQSEHLLGLAHEVRKAKEGMRDKQATDEAGTYFGFRYVWPQLFTQLALLRLSLKWHPGQPVDYGVVYSLEAQVKQALQTYDAESSEALIFQIEHGFFLETPFLAHLDGHVTLNFLAQRGGKQRLRNLTTMLRNYWNPMQPAHNELVASVKAAAEKHQCGIESIETGEWPEKVSW